MVALRKTNDIQNFELSHVPVLVSVKKLHPSPENDKLYRPVDINDPETRQLAESIRRFGVKEPLVLKWTSQVCRGETGRAERSPSQIRRHPS